MFDGNISEQASYWDKQWAGRVDGDGVAMNMSKMKFLIRELLKRPYYADATILDIGCGTGIHAEVISRNFPKWKENWHGIDLSESGVSMAQRFGFKASVANIYTFSSDIRFNAFLFLDVLEHMEDHIQISRKVREHAKESFRIFGNIPLYSLPSHPHYYERPIGRVELTRFLANCGARGFWQRIYGSFGYPYMVFEAEVGG